MMLYTLKTLNDNLLKSYKNYYEYIRAKHQNQFK